MDLVNTPRRQPNNDPHTNMPINTTNTNTNTSTNTRSSTPSSTLGITNPAAAPNVNRRPRMKSSDESIATKQLQDRAFTALMNHQLLLRYAVANDVVSYAFVPVLSDRVSESVYPGA